VLTNQRPRRNLISDFAVSRARVDQRKDREMLHHEKRQSGAVQGDVKLHVCVELIEVTVEGIAGFRLVIWSLNMGVQESKFRISPICSSKAPTVAIEIRFGHTCKPQVPARV
jgi:hypothetical protein